MSYTQYVFWLLAVLLLSCGGGEPPGGGPDDGDGCPGGSCVNDDGKVNGSAGTLVVTSEPAIPGAPPLQVWECASRNKISLQCEGDEFMLAEGQVAGEAIRVSLSEGTHHVRFSCPGYGYSVAGYEFLATGPAHSFRATVADWIMDLEISSGAELAIHAVLCRDFTEETWYGFDNLDDNFETGLFALGLGYCHIFGLQPPLDVRGNMILTNSAWNICDGIEAPVENDRHFEFDCPTTPVSHYEYNRLVE